MPFQTLPSRLKGKKYFFNSNTNNTGENQLVTLSYLPGQRLKEIRIKTFMNPPGLTYTFGFLFLNDPRFQMNFPLLPLGGPLFANPGTDLNGQPLIVDQTTKGVIVVNVDATLTRETSIYLDMENIPSIVILSATDSNTACQAEIEFILSERGQ